MVVERGLRAKMNPIDDLMEINLIKDIELLVEYWKSSPSNRLQRTKILDNLEEKIR